MKRTYKNNSFTDEELANLKAGLCWCGKPRKEFEKGMRVYCTPEHRTIWYSKTLTWQEFRNSFLHRHGEHCDKCGISREDGPRNKAERERISFFDKLRPKVADDIIAHKLTKFEDDYEQTLRQLTDPNNISDYELLKYCQEKNITVPDIGADFTVQFEVDHKLAIVNGGAEFDESNLQVLCSGCHKKKTKQDVSASVAIPVNMEDVEVHRPLEEW